MTGETPTRRSRHSASDAVVVDDGHEYASPDEIRDWLAHASTEFTYTRTFAGAEAVTPDTWLVTNRLEGNFPGGVVDLRYRFRIAGDLISELVIAPEARAARGCVLL